jgi:peptidoglycan/xylan/chitin deacetylase (PgdA/CDA1 family)
MRVSKVAGVGVGAFLGSLSAAAAYGSVSRSSQLFGPSVHRGPGNRKSIALTFDDGPSESTPDLLEYLEEEGIKATFFQCGMNIKRLPHIAGQVAAAGHEIGNHTYSHSKLTFKSQAFIEHEFRLAQEIIEDETGLSPMLLRAPYGFRWIGMRDVQRRLAMLGVMWSVIGYDWRLPAQRISRYVLDRCYPGGIVCLHDGRGVHVRPDIRNTLEAVRRIVPRLRDQGYTFETVSSVLCT